MEVRAPTEGNAPVKERHHSTYASPTGGYVVVGVLGEIEAEWRSLADALASSGYLPVIDDDLASSVTEVLDVINARRPVILEHCVRASEYDTETMAGFHAAWRPIGGGRAISLLSLAPREQLEAIGDISYEASGLGPSESFL